MGVYLAGSYRSQRRTPRRAMTDQFRRWSARDGRPSPAVVFSEWRDVLAALRSLPGVLPVSGAPRFDPGRGSQAAAVAARPGSIDRALSERDASSVTRATPTSGARARP